MSKKSNKQKSPMITLHRALKDARDGEMPPFTPESLVSTLGLEGEKPDDLALMDRFVGDGVSPVRLIGTLRAFIGIKKPLRKLIEATNEHTANPAQEAIAQALGAVVTRQVEREGNWCTLVSEIAESSTREDIVPPEIGMTIAQGEWGADS
jgi:hypothetical protein